MPKYSPTFIGEIITSFLGAIVRGELQGVARDASEEAMELAVNRLRQRFPMPMLRLAREVLDRAIDDPIVSPPPAADDKRENENDVIDVECEVVK